jgi:hypothetical protein
MEQRSDSEIAQDLEMTCDLHPEYVDAYFYDEPVANPAEEIVYSDELDSTPDLS